MGFPRRKWAAICALIGVIGFVSWAVTPTPRLDALHYSFLVHDRSQDYTERGVSDLLEGFVPKAPLYSQKFAACEKVLVCGQNISSVGPYGQGARNSGNHGPDYAGTVFKCYLFTKIVGWVSSFRNYERIPRISWFGQIFHINPEWPMEFHHFERWTLPSISICDRIYDEISYILRNWPLKEDGEGSEPRSIGLDGGVIGALQREEQYDQADQRNDGGNPSDPIKAPGYPDLPFPEAPFIGVMLFFLGGWLSGWGMEKGKIYSHVCGWLVMVGGGAAFVLWALPYIAEVILPPPMP